MDERQLEQEYKKIKQQAAPDLWGRIEANLAEHPERGQRKPEESGNVRPFPQRRHWNHTAALAAAAAVVLLVAVPARERIGWNLKGAGKSMMAAETTAAAAAMDMAAAEGVPETAAYAPEAAEGAPEVEECAPKEAENGPGAAAERSEITGRESAVAAAGGAPAATAAAPAGETAAAPAAETVAETAATVSLTGTVVSVSDAEDTGTREQRIAYEIRVERSGEPGRTEAKENQDTQKTAEAALPAAGGTVTAYRRTDGTSDAGGEEPVPGRIYLLTLVQEDGDWILKTWKAVKLP